MGISNEKDVYYRCYLFPFLFYYNTLYLKLDVEYDIKIFAAIELRSEITFPECSFKKTEQIPTNACQFFLCKEQFPALLFRKIKIVASCF